MDPVCKYFCGEETGQEGGNLKEEELKLLNILLSCHSELHVDNSAYLKTVLLRASPRSAPWGVGACGGHTPLHTHPRCSPSPSAGSGGQWRWTSPSSRRQRCNDTDRLFVLPLNHLLTAGLIKSQGSQDDASYYFSGTGNKTLAAQRGGSYHHQEGILSLACAQDYIYKLLEVHHFQLSFPG